METFAIGFFVVTMIVFAVITATLIANMLATLKEHEKELQSFFNAMSLFSESIQSFGKILTASLDDEHGANYYERTKREVTNIMRVTTDTLASHALDINNLKATVNELQDRIDSLEADVAVVRGEV